MPETIKVKEIFVSTQGEGPFVGCRQLFVRFCGCNLNCLYCDTDFQQDRTLSEYSTSDLKDIIEDELALSGAHSVSFTGGEPLLQVAFLKELLPQLKAKIYLETNATLSENLSEILPFVDVISADIKLPSSTGIHDTFKRHEAFFKVARQKTNLSLFAKMVFDENITDEEICEATRLAKEYDFELILQPKTDVDGKLPASDFMEEVFTKCLGYCKNTRLIPQVHKFLDIR